MPAPLDLLVDATQAELAVLGQRRAAGMNTLDWRMQVQTTLKHAHITAGALARGGWDGLDKPTTGFIGARLRQQYNYLSGVTFDTAPGEFGAADMARLAQYGNGAVRGTHSGVIRRDAPEDAEEQNVLGGSSASCAECLELTDRGPVPVGTLPEVGSRECHGNCGCTIEIVEAGVPVGAEA